MNPTAVARPLPGAGLVARNGDLLMVCADGADGVEELLDLVSEVAAAGGDGTVLIRRVAALLAADFDDRFPACAATGPAPDGRLAVLVYRDATAEIAGADGQVSLSGAEAFTSVNRLVAGPVTAIKLQLPGAGPASPRARLDGGIVVAGGVDWSDNIGDAAGAAAAGPVSGSVGGGLGAALAASAGSMMDGAPVYDTPAPAPSSAPPAYEPAAAYEPPASAPPAYDAYSAPAEQYTPPAQPEAYTPPAQPDAYVAPPPVEAYAPPPADAYAPAPDAYAAAQPYAPPAEPPYLPPPPDAYAPPAPEAYTPPQPAGYIPLQPDAYPPAQQDAYAQPPAYPPAQPDAYAQPQPDAYAQPQPDAYAQPQPQAYIAPQPDAYAQPPAEGYAPPPAEAYATPPADAYAAPSAPPYYPPPEAPPLPPPVPDAAAAAPPAQAEGAPVVIRTPDPAAPFVAVLLVGDHVEADEPPAPVVDMRPRVLGVLCKNDHFNDPNLRYCSVCGISMAQQTLVKHEGPRPPLGVLLMDDGMTFRLDTDYVIGREPQHDPEVVAGAVRPLRVADAEGVVSRRHARVALVGWDVQVVDLGSANGTYVQLPGDPQRHQLAPNQPVVVQPGTLVTLGRRWFRYESHRNP